MERILVRLPTCSETDTQLKTRLCASPIQAPESFMAASCTLQICIPTRSTARARRRSRHATGRNRRRRGQGQASLGSCMGALQLLFFNEWSVRSRTQQGLMSCVGNATRRYCLQTILLIIWRRIGPTMSILLFVSQVGYIYSIPYVNSKVY